MNTTNFQKKIIAENPQYLLATLEPGNILYQEHFQTTALGKPELREILKIISSGNFAAYLIKVNNGSILPPDDLSWVENFNLMRLYKAGISLVAYVSPQNIFNSLEMKKEIQPGKTFHIKIFKKMEDALNWLQKELPEPLLQDES